LRDRQFEIIVSDYDMAPLTGLDLWSLVRKATNHAGTLLILVTSSHGQARLTALHSELPVILCRPFNGKMLQRAILMARGGEPPNAIEV
jgi:DNA-binding response OmpR family regulator